MTEPTKTYYFSYGSNMNPDQLEARFHQPTALAIARLPGHRFAFTRRAPQRNCGVMDILPDPQGEVWGVVYEVQQSDLEALDQSRPAYRRAQKTVHLNGDPLQAVQASLYEVIDKAPQPIPPNTEYKGLLLKGAHTWGLPQSYIQALEAIETAP